MIATHVARLSRRGRSERGAAAVEFAIVLPILVVLLFAIIGFSIAFNRQQGLHAAAREGARVAALPQSDQATITATVRSALDGVLTPSEINAATITITPSDNQPCDAAPPGTHVVVKVTSPDTISIPLWSSPTVTITGTGEFLCE